MIDSAKAHYSKRYQKTRDTDSGEKKY